MLWRQMLSLATSWTVTTVPDKYAYPCLQIDSSCINAVSTSIIFNSHCDLPDICGSDSAKFAGEDSDVICVRTPATQYYDLQRLAFAGQRPEFDYYLLHDGHHVHIHTSEFPRVCASHDPTTYLQPRADGGYTFSSSAFPTLVHTVRATSISEVVISLSIDFPVPYMVTDEDVDDCSTVYAEEHSIFYAGMVYQIGGHTMRFSDTNNKYLFSCAYDQLSGFPQIYSDWEPRYSSFKCAVDLGTGPWFNPTLSVGFIGKHTGHDLDTVWLQFEIDRICTALGVPVQEGYHFSLRNVYTTYTISQHRHYCYFTWDTPLGVTPTEYLSHDGLYAKHSNETSNGVVSSTSAAASTFHAAVGGVEKLLFSIIKAMVRFFTLFLHDLIPYITGLIRKLLDAILAHPELIRKFAEVAKFLFGHFYEVFKPLIEEFLLDLKSAASTLGETVAEVFRTILSEVFSGGGPAPSGNFLIDHLLHAFTFIATNIESFLLKFIDTSFDYFLASDISVLLTTILFTCIYLYTTKFVVTCIWTCLIILLFHVATDPYRYI